MRNLGENYGHYKAVPKFGSHLNIDIYLNYDRGSPVSCFMFDNAEKV